MPFDTTTTVTDEVTDNLAQYHNELKTAIDHLMSAAAYANYKTATTMSGNATLTDASLPIQVFDPDAARDVSLPAEASTNHMFYIMNIDAVFTLTIKDDSPATIGTIPAGQSAMIFSDGVRWKMAGGTPVPAQVALTDGATINWDASMGVYASVTLGGNRTFAAPTNLKAGETYTLKLTQDGTGGRNPTWNAVFKNVPQIDLVASAVTVLEFVSDGTNLYYSGGLPVDVPTETITSSATPTPTAAINKLLFSVTALAAAPTFGAPGGSPKNGYTMLWRIKDNGTARALAYNAIYRAMGVTLPTTTVVSKWLVFLWVYNSTDTKWDLLAANQEA